MNIDKIYIIHYNELIDRKKYLDNILKSFDYEYEYIINYKHSDDILYKYENLFIGNNKRIPKNQLVVTLSHIKVYNDIFINDYKTCLILEDDAIFLDAFEKNINSIVIESKKYDFSFLSDGCNLHTLKTNSNYLYESNTSRTCCAYLINNTDNFKLLAQNPFPITDAIDWHLNIVKSKYNLRFSWCEPSVFMQGSENNIYKSNLR